MSPSDHEWRHKVEKRARWLYGLAADSRLRLVATRAMDEHADEKEYLESIAGGMVGQPPGKWSRSDEDTFARLVPQVSTQVRTLEATQQLTESLQEGEQGYLVAVNGVGGQDIREIVRFSPDEKVIVEEMAHAMISETSAVTNRRLKMAALTEALRLLSQPSSDETNQQPLGED